MSSSHFQYVRTLTSVWADKGLEGSKGIGFLKPALTKAETILLRVSAFALEFSCISRAARASFYRLINDLFEGFRGKRRITSSHMGLRLGRSASEHRQPALPNQAHTRVSGVFAPPRNPRIRRLIRRFLRDSTDSKNRLDFRKVAFHECVRQDIVIPQSFTQG